MKITLHLGAHHARTARLAASIKASARALQRLDVLAPSPEDYHLQVKSILQHLDGLPPIVTEEDALLKNILGGQTGKHLLLINEEWSGPANRIFKNGKLYDSLARNALQITELFSQHELRISFTICNPAYLLNTAYNTPNRPVSLEKLMASYDPTTLNWREPVSKLREALPDVPLLMWREEDTPLIWPRVLCNFADIPDNTLMRGGLGATSDALTPEGNKLFLTALRAAPPQSRAEYEERVLTFLDEHANEDIITQRFNLPGWTNEMVSRMTERYQQDVEAFSNDANITFVRPETQF